MNELFDVTTLFSYGCYQGLFFDRQLQLWTSQNGRFRRLANQCSLPSGEYPHTLSQLRNEIVQSKAFRDFLRQVRVALRENDEKKNSLRGKFVIAIVNDEGLPVFSENPKVFDTREEADIKLLRYQQINPDTRFCLFECKGELKSIGVVLE